MLLNIKIQKNKYQFLIRPLVEAYDIGVAVQAIQLLNLQLNKQKIEEAINEDANSW
jgi:dihydrofolate synthase/folylpolyglutamate synthase